MKNALILLKKKKDNNSIPMPKLGKGKIISNEVVVYELFPEIKK